MTRIGDWSRHDDLPALPRAATRRMQRMRLPTPGAGVTEDEMRALLDVLAWDADVAYESVWNPSWRASPLTLEFIRFGSAPGYVEPTGPGT